MRLAIVTIAALLTGCLDLEGERGLQGPGVRDSLLVAGVFTEQHRTVDTVPSPFAEILPELFPDSRTINIKDAINLIPYPEISPFAVFRLYIRSDSASAWIPHKMGWWGDIEGSEIVVYQKSLCLGEFPNNSCPEQTSDSTNGNSHYLNVLLGGALGYQYKLEVRL